MFNLSLILIACGFLLGDPVAVVQCSMPYLCAPDEDTPALISIKNAPVCRPIGTLASFVGSTSGPLVGAHQLLAKGLRLPVLCLTLGNVQRRRGALPPAQCMDVVLYSRCWDVVPYMTPLYLSRVPSAIPTISIGSAAVTSVTAEVLSPTIVATEMSLPDLYRIRLAYIFRRAMDKNLHLELIPSVYFPLTLLDPSPVAFSTLAIDTVVLLAWKAVAQKCLCISIPAPSPPRPRRILPPQTRRPLRQLILQQVESNMKVPVHAPHVPKPEPAPPKPLSTGSASPPQTPPRSYSAPIVPIIISHTASISPTKVSQPASSSNKSPVDTPQPTKILHALTPNPAASALGRKLQQQKPQHQHQNYPKRFTPPRVQRLQNTSPPRHSLPTSRTSTTPPPTSPSPVSSRGFDKENVPVFTLPRPSHPSYSSPTSHPQYPPYSYPSAHAQPHHSYAPPLAQGYWASPAAPPQFFPPSPGYYAPPAPPGYYPPPACY